MILADKKDCCGCAACYNACNIGAIKMIENKAGFYYPQIDENKCVNCGKCSKACPVLTKVEVLDNLCPNAFVAQNKDNLIREESTSGGAFSALATDIIMSGGAVYGATMDENFVVYHTGVYSVDELQKFRNSKYVQSEIRDSYSCVKKDLQKNIPVMFSGTPCQVQGLLRFLGKKYEKLITVDLVCHSVPSPAVFRKYMELQKKKYPSVERVVFRDKKRGYDYSTMALYGQKKGKESCLYREGSESDLWFRSFLPGLCDRENCYNCEYQTYPRQSDITIWDCFTIGKIYPEFDDNKGTTSIVAWTDKGKNLVKECKQINIHKVDVEIFLDKINRELDKKININREKMYDDLEKLDPEAFFEKYRKVTVKHKIKKFMRELLYYIGLHHKVKQMLSKLGD